MQTDSRIVRAQFKEQLRKIKQSFKFELTNNRRSLFMRLLWGNVKLLSDGTDMTTEL
jgi:hypothetical protein